MGLTWPLLYDRGRDQRERAGAAGRARRRVGIRRAAIRVQQLRTRTVQQDLDIQDYTDPTHDPMIPHTLVLKPGLVIHRIYNGYWFWAARRPRTSARTCAP